MRHILIEAGRLQRTAISKASTGRFRDEYLNEHGFQTLHRCVRHAQPLALGGDGSHCRGFLHQSLIVVAGLPRFGAADSCKALVINGLAHSPKRLACSMLLVIESNVAALSATRRFLRRPNTVMKGRVR